MNHTGSIESAEQNLQQILEEFFISAYDETSLPSHGLYHHRRVWGYVKELLKTGLFDQDRSEMAEKLIIASYLHDIGMSVEKGPMHGSHSRDLCLKFFDRTGLDPENYSDVLEAIENHDRKDYPEIMKGSGLLEILSLADDMDAFGFTGIYRYAEIYLLRGIKPENLGYSIKENALKRFSNFEKTIRSDKKFLQKQKERYLLLDGFFSNYNIQAPTYKFGTAYIHGYCGVIEVIKKSLENNSELKDIDPSSQYPQDSVISWFFAGLRKEML